MSLCLVLKGGSIILYLTTQLEFVNNTCLKGVCLFGNMIVEYLSNAFNFFIKSTILGLSIFGVDTGTGVRKPAAVLPV